MKRFILISVFFLLVTGMYAQTNKREYSAIRTTIHPKIDGILDDACWQNAKSATDLLQLRPVEGKPAMMNTEVKVLYDDIAIYVYAMMYDSSPDSINKELGMRDHTEINADAFYIGFIPYNLLDAYVFGLTASGVQIDTRDSDPTFDAVWESSVKINDKGWAAEMKIPYSAIRFPSVDIQTWGFQFTRDIKRTGEYDQWALTPRTLANSRIMWGTINGISDIKAPLRLSLTPFISGYYENAPQINANDGSVKYNNLYSYNFGADLKYGIDEKFTLDLTLMPDFNQVQSDNKIKNLSYNEVTYNENRPFFKEGTELFTQNSLFYSRRIGQTPSGYYSLPYQLNEGESIKENPSKTRLLNAIKLSGRNNNGLGIGFFNAITANTYAIVEDSTGNRRKVLTEPLTNYNVIVFDQQLKNNSSFYLINTNVLRDKDFPDANVTGSGFTLFNKSNSYAIDGNVALSQKFSKHDSLPDTFEDLMGYRYFFGARKSSGKFQFGYSHTIINKSYDSRDMGYYVIGNKMNEKVYVSFNTFKPNKLFRESYNSITFDYGTNPVTGKTIYSQINLSLYATLLDYSNCDLGATVAPLKTFDYYEPRVDGRFSKSFRYYYLYADFNSDTRKALALELHLEGGDFIESFRGVAFGNQTGIRYRFNDRLQAKYIFNYNNDSYNIGFAGFDNNNNIIYGGRQLITFVNSLSCQYLFTKDMNLTLTARHYWNTGDYKKYYLLLDNGGISEMSDYQSNNNYSYNVFNIDLMYTWQFAPGSSMSLVYKNAIESETGELTRNFSRNFENTFDSPQTNSVSLKILYYLDYQYLSRNRRDA